jgi:Uma2 family endonuclease
MTVLSTLLTSEDLLALNEHQQRCELIRGELIMMSPASANHGVVAARLLLFVGGFVDEQGLGATFAAETGFKIESDPDTVRAPDVAFVAKHRLGDGLPARGYFIGAPDLAIEVISPDETKKSVMAKARMWLQKGCKSVWIVDPIATTITLLRPKRKPVVLRNGATLTNEPTLPGSTLPLKSIFKLM